MIKNITWNKILNIINMNKIKYIKISTIIKVSTI